MQIYAKRIHLRKMLQLFSCKKVAINILAQSHQIPIPSLPHKYQINKDDNIHIKNLKKGTNKQINYF